MPCKIPRKLILPSTLFVEIRRPQDLVVAVAQGDVIVFDGVGDGGCACCGGAGGCGGHFSCCSKRSFDDWGSIGG